MSSWQPATLIFSLVVFDKPFSLHRRLLAVWCVTIYMCNLKWSWSLKCPFFRNYNQSLKRLHECHFKKNHTHQAPGQTGYLDCCVVYGWQSMLKYKCCMEHALQWHHFGLLTWPGDTFRIGLDITKMKNWWWKWNHKPDDLKIFAAFCQCIPPPPPV